MPDQPETPRQPQQLDRRPPSPPSAESPGNGAGRFQSEPPEAVLFDFHGTLVQVEDAVTWVQEAGLALGLELDRMKATVLADRLVTAGRAGGPRPYRVPPHLAEVYADRDLYPEAHRAAYTGLAQSVDCGVEGLAEALYERMLSATGWIPYADTLPTLGTLRDAGVPVAVISNIGFDIRPICADLGFGHLVDEFVLSYEVGRCKPDPAIFLRACRLLRVDPERSLMVGDTPADAGAVDAGCRALIVPAAEPGASNGIGAVLDIVGV